LKKICNNVPAVLTRVAVSIAKAHTTKADLYFNRVQEIAMENVDHYHVKLANVNVKPAGSTTVFDGGC